MFRETCETELRAVSSYFFNGRGLMKFLSPGYKKVKSEGEGRNVKLVRKLMIKFIAGCRNTTGCWLFIIMALHLKMIQACDFYFSPKQKHVSGKNGNMFRN